jgi:hypothetical protein
MAISRRQQCAIVEASRGSLLLRSLLLIVHWCPERTLIPIVLARCLRFPLDSSDTRLARELKALCAVRIFIGRRVGEPQ